MAIAGSAFLLAACSDAGGGSPLRRRDSSGTDAVTPNDGSRGGSNASPMPDPSPPSAPPASPVPPGAPDGGVTTSPDAATPAPVGSCGTPKCFGVGGFGGCKATDSAGAEVTMGCQGGGCACRAAGHTTATFSGNVNSASDAAQLFLANCACK